MSDSLPKDVQALLGSQVESYEHLAILLQMHSDRLRGWSETELAETLRIPAQLAAGAVSGLRQAGLVGADPQSSPPRYRYVASGAADEAVGRLAQEFTQNPARVVKLMSAIAIERLRASALHAFADAFVLNKKDDDRG